MNQIVEQAGGRGSRPGSPKIVESRKIGALCRTITRKTCRNIYSKVIQSHRGPLSLRKHLLLHCFIHAALQYLPQVGSGNGGRWKLTPDLPPNIKPMRSRCIMVGRGYDSECSEWAHWCGMGMRVVEVGVAGGRSGTGSGST